MSYNRQQATMSHRGPPQPEATKTLDNTPPPQGPPQPLMSPPKWTQAFGGGHPGIWNFGGGGGPPIKMVAAVTPWGFLGGGGGRGTRRDTGFLRVTTDLWGRKPPPLPRNGLGGGGRGDVDVQGGPRCQRMMGSSGVGPIMARGTRLLGGTQRQVFGVSHLGGPRCQGGPTSRSGPRCQGAGVMQASRSPLLG